MVHSTPEIAVITKRFENSDELREFPKGRFELVNIGGMTIGRATYEPGWRWSVDVGPGIGLKLCGVEHLGLEPHDSWVIGNERYVSLHFLGASHYAK